MLGFKRCGLFFVMAGAGPAWRAFGLVARAEGPRFFTFL